MNFSSRIKEYWEISKALFRLILECPLAVVAVPALVLYSIFDDRSDLQKLLNRHGATLEDVPGSMTPADIEREIREYHKTCKMRQATLTEVKNQK
jgi:hypothetical protein